MKKICTIILFGIFTLSILLFSIFGEAVRNHFSPAVKVMAVNQYIFSDGSYTMTAVANSCVTMSEDGVSTAYIIEERSDAGEKAFYAKKVEINIGIVDDRAAEIWGFDDLRALFICNSDRELSDGKRVVLDGILNGP